MRVSNQMMNQLMSGNIRDDQSAVYSKSQQISSGKRFQFASEDPTAWSRAAHLHGEQGRLAQYEQNAGLLENQLTSIDQSLDSIGNILQSASEIAVRGSDGTLGQSDQATLAEQVDQLLEELVSQANGKYNGHYQFGGVKTDVEPFTVTRNADGKIDSVSYVGADSASKVGIADDDALPGQVVGGDSNNGLLLSDSNDAFSALIKMRDQLMAGNNLANTSLQSQVDNAFERVIVGRAGIGAYLEHISFVGDIRSNQTEQVKNDLSATEGIDTAQAATELSQKQTAYQAALAMASQTMRKSLLDYL